MTSGDDDRLFAVIDTEAGVPATMDHMKEVVMRARAGEFGCGLIWCDLEGWHIDEYGQLSLADECGNHEYAPERYRVVLNRSRGAALTEILGKMLSGYDALLYECKERKEGMTANEYKARVADLIDRFAMALDEP